MASATYEDDLTCSICLAIFTDPVSLLCGHSFCRECVMKCLTTQKLCPQCRTDCPAAEVALRTNYVLQSLATKAKEGGRSLHSKSQETDWYCHEHEEKLKLYCETDQQLACVICRDSEKHDGHIFKPIKEAAMIRKRELEKAIQFICSDNAAIEQIIKNQVIIQTISLGRSQQLLKQIGTQFEEMHTFLTKREEKIKSKMQTNKTLHVNKMHSNLFRMNSVLSQRRQTEASMRSAMDIPESEGFLKWWDSKGTSQIQALRSKDMPQPQSLRRKDTTLFHVQRRLLPTQSVYRKNKDTFYDLVMDVLDKVHEPSVTEDPFQSGADALQVISYSLYPPCEGKLQFTIWKEMLEVIRPLPKQITLTVDGESFVYSHGTFFSSRNPLKPVSVSQVPLTHTIWDLAHH